MKSRIAAVAAAAALLAPAAGMAAGSHTLNVTATVNGTCSFDLPNSAMAFGAIDPSGVTPATATAAVDFHCSNGQAYTVTLSGTGSYTLTGPAAATIPYTAAITGGASGTGTGMTGAASTVSVGATIAVTDYQNAAAGAYTGTLTLNVAP